MTETAVPDIVILGGGSAGWITACLLQQAWGGRGGSVTVIESPEIGIIGVGEGSTPQLKAFFGHIGVAEADWMAACDATYKLGIRFTGWSERAGFESYYHPFPGPVDMHTEPAFIRNCDAARRGFDVPAHPDGYFLASHLSAEAKGPHAAASFPFAPSYGYHFDAHKLGAFLRDHAVAKGVTHLQETVAEVELNESGDVAALLCDGGRRVEGEFFVDCSGFRSLIMQQALGEDFIPFGENLFNDRAVVMPTPRGETFKPQTEAIAMKAGWRWSIPLTARTGNGYVYASSDISDGDAERELREALGLLDSDVEARFLKMKVGRVEKSWSRNCLAAGLSQGFLEPLEATALHIVISTAMEFVQAYESGGFTARNRDIFNTNTAARYEGIRDYIVAHYRMNQRSGSDYWRRNAANQHLSDGLKTLMTAWFTHQPIGAAIDQAYPQRYYSEASWHCLLAGYGTFPPQAKMQPAPSRAMADDTQKVRDLIASCAQNFGTALAG